MGQSICAEKAGHYSRHKNDLPLTGKRQNNIDMLPIKNGRMNNLAQANAQVFLKPGDFGLLKANEFSLAWR